MTEPSQDYLADYRRKAQTPGLRAVLDPGDETGVKNAYLDFVHRRALRKWIDSLGSRVADLGCGIGRLTEMLREATVVVGLDGSPELLTLARERLGPAAGLARADLASLPVASGTLTGAMMCFVSLHFDEETAARAFDEVGRVLQPGGFFLLLEHVAPGPEPRVYHGVLNRTVARLGELLDHAGFETVRKVAVKKTPSRSVHWVRTGRLPRRLWRVGAILDGLTATRGLDHADYVECLLVARKRGGDAADLSALPSLGGMLGGLVMPPKWFDRRERRPGR